MYISKDKSMSVLNAPVLVLNSSWMPITVIPADRAIALLYTSKARAIDTDDFSTYDFESWTDLKKIFTDGEYIRTTRLNIAIPDVLLLRSNTQPSYRNVTFSRKNLLKRDRRTCQYCGKKVGTDSFTIDHVMPKSRKGGTSWLNCVIACVKCNLKKDNKTPDEANMKLRTVPSIPTPRRINYSIDIFAKKVSWQKFVKDDRLRDELASVVYWNCGLKD